MPTKTANSRKRGSRKASSGTVKKVFTHGGCKAINLPNEFTKNLSGQFISIETYPNKVIVRNTNPLDNMESDPLFNSFIEGVMKDALENPEKLHDLSEAWGNIDELLEDVPLDDTNS